MKNKTKKTNTTGQTEPVKLVEVSTTAPDGTVTVSEANVVGEATVVKPKRKYVRRLGPKKPVKRKTVRERIRGRLHTMVKKAMSAQNKDMNMADVKILYELLLKDEGAQFEREKMEAAKVEATPIKPVVPSQEELVIYTRRLLGKGITL
jgi:hypothetical protein